MTLRQLNFNSTDGTTVTTGNSGALSIATGTGSTQTYKSAAAYQGSTGVEIVSTGATSALRFQFTGAATATQAAFSVRFKIPSSLPSAVTSFLQINDTAAAKVLSINYTTSGNVSIYDKNNTSNQIMAAAQATAGSWFRIEIVVTNLSTTAGAFTGRAYSSGSTQVGSTVNVTTGNTGTTAMGGCYLGCVQTTVTITEDLDNLQMNDGATSEIGEYVPNTTPPTVVAGANQTISAPGSQVNLTCTATPAGGSAGIASYAWTLVSGFTSAGATSSPTLNNATSQTSNFTPASRGRYIFQVTATDLEGNTSSPVTTRVFVPDTVFVPIEVTSNSGWTAAVASLQDASDATYAESGAPGSGGVLVLRLSPMVQATSGFDLDVRSLVQTVGGSQKVALLEGGTTRKDWGAIAPGTAFADQHLTLTTGEMATVTSWNELDLQFTQV